MANLGKGVFRNSKANNNNNGGGLFKPSFFRVKVVLDPTGEVFAHKVYLELTVRSLKAELEFLTGMPANIQRVWYLDEADLNDESDLRQNFIVQDGVFHVSIHYSLCPLLQAVKENDMERVFNLGVTQTGDYSSPNLEFLAKYKPQARRQLLAERAFLALFMASHRGHVDLCEKLLQSGARVNRVTSFGRSPLHVAAASGNGDVMDVLLERGAKAGIMDVFGDNPSAVALRYGHKECDRHLFMFRWQQRAKKAKDRDPPPVTN